MDKPVGLLKRCRCTALGALMFDKKINSSLRTGCRNGNPVDFPHHTLDKVWAWAYRRPDDRIVGRIWRSV